MHMWEVAGATCAYRSTLCLIVACLDQNVRQAAPDRPNRGLMKALPEKIEPALLDRQVCRRRFTQGRSGVGCGAPVSDNATARG